MCGIAGFLSGAPLAAEAHQTVRRMGDTLAHRGPDGHGEWVDAEAGVALAHRRLAIVDTSAAGTQPMRSACGRWVMVFNGEIYNHADLRAQLEAAGRAPTWTGHSDTETLLATIAAWGLRTAIDRAVGMFAIALWDRQSATLTLVRDRMGEKPLYFGWLRGTFVFASELKAVRAHPAFDGELDPGAVALLMRYGYVPAPWSVYRGLRKLPPGTLVTIAGTRPGDVTPESYWSVSDTAAAGARQPLQLSDEAAVAELDRLLRQSIAGQRVADVPLGAFLSGGIDSSTTVAVMQSLSERPVRTFTIAVPEAGLDESDHARAVARHLGTDHTELALTARDALDVIPRLPQMYCEPFADASQIPTFLVSQLARRSVTVSLSGDAGDELFGGYERYFWARRIAGTPLLARRLSGHILKSLPAEVWAAAMSPITPWMPRAFREGHLPDRLRKLASVLSAPTDDDVYRQILEFWPMGASPCPATERPSAFSEPPSGLPRFESRMMLLDMRTYLPDDILVKVDRAAMAASLETRVPMLDHRLVEFALRLPLHQKIRGGQGKWILRRVLDRYVPRALVERPKQGFGIPIHDWLRGPLRDWTESLLSESALHTSGLVDPTTVRQTWLEHLAGRNDWGYRLWPVLMFQAWHASNPHTALRP